jgi:hypothetical protein
VPRLHRGGGSLEELLEIALRETANARRGQKEHNREADPGWSDLPSATLRNTSESLKMSDSHAIAEGHGSSNWMFAHRFLSTTSMTGRLAMAKRVNRELRMEITKVVL